MGEITVFIPNEIPRLKDLDTLLRCGICFEYMKTSMITKCSHNYCSLCIRKSLIYKAQCPLCFEDAFDNQLRNNRIVDDIIEIFGTLLDEVKSFMQDNGQFSETSKKGNKMPDYLQKSHSVSDSRVKSNTQNKGIVNNVFSNERDNEACGKLSQCATGSAASSYVSKSEAELSDCGDFARLQHVTPKKESHQSSDHRSKVAKSDISIPEMFSPKKKQNVAQMFVACPVCNVDIPEKNINIHLDVCLKRSEKSDQLISPTRVQKRKPLPKLVYSLLQDKKVREMLKQLGLGTQGDRKALISRHQRFTLLYNSENDNLNPRSTADIVRQVEREEQEEKTLSAATSSANKLKIDQKTDPKLITQAQQQYIQNNKSSFEKLIQSMRNREAEKKSVVKRKLILSDDENDSEDGNREARVKNVPGQKCTVRNPVISSDEEGGAVEKGHSLYKPCDDVLSVIANVSDNGNVSEETVDMNYEALSPVLGRNVTINLTRKQNEECCEEEVSVSIGVILGKKSAAVSSGGQQPGGAEASDTGSNQSCSILTQNNQEPVRSIKRNAASEINETLTRRGMSTRLNSQYDADFEPSSGDALDCFEIRTSPIRRRRRRKNARLSPQPSSSREGRVLKNSYQNN